jgi:hypothetical protein
MSKLFIFKLLSTEKINSAFLPIYYSQLQASKTFFGSFNLKMLKLNFSLCCFYFPVCLFKNAERRKNENIQLKLHMLCMLLLFLLFSFSPGCEIRKKNIWNAKIIQATPQNSHIIKFISNFWLLLFSHFSLGFFSLLFHTQSSGGKLEAIFKSENEITEL